MQKSLLIAVLLLSSSFAWAGGSEADDKPEKMVGAYGAVGYRGFAYVKLKSWAVSYWEIPVDSVWIVGGPVALSFGWSFYDFSLARLNVGLGLGWAWPDFAFNASVIWGPHEVLDSTGTDTETAYGVEGLGGQLHVTSRPFKLFAKVLPRATGQRKGLLTTRLLLEPFEVWSYTYWRERYTGWRRASAACLAIPDVCDNRIVRSEWVENVVYGRYGHWTVIAGQNLFVAPDGIRNLYFYELGYAGLGANVSFIDWLLALGLGHRASEEVGVTASFLYPISFDIFVFDIRLRGGYFLDGTFFFDGNLQIVASG